MAEFKLGRIRFIWKNEWAAGTTYLKDDIVRLNGKVYVCVAGHTAQTDFYTDINHVPTRWNQMSDGMQWRGDWEVDTVYYINDIIKWGGQVYICTLGHTSASTFEIGPEDEITGPTSTHPGDDSSLSKWQIFAQSFYWTGDWLPDYRYKLNDIVKYGGNMYLCNLAHHSAATDVLGLEADQSKWDLFTEGYDWKGDWVPSTSLPTFVASRYKKNDIVRYGGTTYVCNTGHIAATSFEIGLEDDQSKWDYFNQGFEYKTQWLPDTRYKINDIVKYGSDLWICTTFHTSGTTFSEVDWAMFSEGLQFDDSWDIGTIYQPGDIVGYGGYTYISKTNHLSRFPSQNPSDWALFTTGFNFRGDWADDSALVDYRVGDVVRLHGYTYVCVADHNGVEPPDVDFWQRLNSGIRWEGNWVSGTTYILGDAVRDGTNSYIAIQKHVASTPNQPANDISGTYWNLLAGGQEANVLTTQGDLVYYGGAGPTRLPVGADGQVLVVNAADAPSWKYFGLVDQLYYVAVDGVDAPAPTRGVTLDKPWNTVRYAAEQIDNGARNPQAAYLLKINRQFIQREVLQWITYQIANNISPFVTGFTYDTTKCERDIGLIVDAIIWDLTHGGNVRTVAAIRTYINTAPTFYSLGQKEETAAAITYAGTVMTAVLANAAPAVNYQVTNGVSVGSRILQIINTAYTTESGVNSIATGLISNISSAVLSGLVGSIPTEVKPNVTILVKTGTYYEVLPIIVPVETAVVGDELRSTNIRPRAGTTPSTDVPYSLAAIDRVKSILTNVLIGNDSITASMTGSTISGPTISITGHNSTAGATPWTTEFTITPQLVFPPTGGYTIAGATTSGFNGTVTVTSSTLTTITVTYGSDPGTWVAGGTPTITATNGTTLTVGTLASGTIYPGMQLTGSGVTAGTYIIKNVSGTGTGSKWIVSTSQSVTSTTVTGTSAKSTTNSGTLSATLPLATSTQVPLVHAMLQNMRDYIDKKINGPGDITLPSMTGSVAPVETYNVYAAVRQLELNRSFIVQEVVAWLTETYPSYTYNSTLCQRDVNRYIDALQYDLTYTGNYKSLYCARYYVNSVNGSLTEDMFYVRNGTGIRNLTVQGLTGTLGSANVYGTKRPTAGAYTSLDPGWGPDDTRVWITNKSCYVQNVTTFGTACIGLKIDGTLHNGGNRSVVANDFTQVISDGIGVWCTGSKAVTELVSVFSYYGHIGYLAENGGKIRATNGNSSYGTYGTVSEGVDATEVAVTGTVNNYASEATVGNTVTNGTNIMRLEYNNAGTNYSSGTYTFNGAGINAAAVGNEIRDAAVFEVRILQTNDSSGQYGGSGYIVQQNVAQTGGLYNVTLAATDAATSSAYTGIRIFINSGTAAAQQAYILNYNAGSKVALICKESFTPFVISATTVTTNVITVASTSTLYIGMPIYFSGTAGGGVGINTLYYITTTGFTATTFSIATSLGGTAITLSTATPALTINAAGWDNALVGTPAAAPDGSSLYTLEPRVTFTAPTFSENGGTSLPSATWARVGYGYTSSTYTSIAATGGSGSSARFDIVRSGLDYTVTLNTAGTGYTKGNTLTIAGTSLGGASPANDITIAVTSVVDTPTVGVISTWEATGTAYGGQYVALPASGTTAARSVDGQTWASVTLPTAGNWAVTANGLVGSQYYQVALASGATNGLYSIDGGTSWTAVTGLAASSTWTDMAYGNGRFIAVANNSAVPFISTTGTSWAVGGSMGATTTWTGIAYGGANGTNGNVFVAVASGGTSAVWSTNGNTWTAAVLPTSANWTGVAWGNGRFVAISSTASSTGGYVGAYSFDGITWRSCNVDNAVAWNKISYGQGLFMVTSTTSTTKIATSEDGINWKSQTLGATSTWINPVFGNSNRTGNWVVISSAASSTVTRYITTGATTKARVAVDSSNHLTQFRLYEPGSGYSSAPTMTIVDPGRVYAGQYTVRTGNGALAQPTFTNRGTLWTTAATTVIGNGYADYFQAGSYVVVKGLTTVPIAGSNVEFSTLPGTYYKLVTITNLLGTGPYTATFQLSPAVSVSNATLLTHGTPFEVRIKYSQVRLTGHDFLSIGFGNFSDTNYPNTPVNQLDANKQTVESGGGRCFYTATDQDGNFTVGTLFSVQQSTGTATLNASAFNLAGLQSLQLGSVTVGSSGATINEFSTDPFFTANSDSVLSTQRAIKAYIASQIGSGSSTLNVNTLTAGAIFVSGNSITTTNGLQITVPNKMTFTGGIDGYPLAFNMFLQN